VRPGMSRAVASAVAGALTLVSLSACGSVQDNGSRAGATSSAATSDSPPSSVTPPTTKRTKPMPVTPTGPPGEFTQPPPQAGRQSTVRVRGTLSDGVESGCTLLTSKGVVYLLLWGDKPRPTG